MCGRTGEEVFGEALVCVDRGDIEGFAREVISLLEEEARAKKIIEDAIVQVGKYDWNAIAEEERLILDSLFDA